MALLGHQTLFQHLKIGLFKIGFSRHDAPIVGRRSAEGDVVHVTPMDATENRLHVQLKALVESDRFDPPRLPHIASQVMQLTQDVNMTFPRMASVVARDQFLTASVFRIANSAYYRGREPCQKLSQAMSRIGMDGLKQLVMTVALKGRIFRCRRYSHLMNAIWRHSVAAAISADMIAKAVGRPTELAFVAGLLHDIGQPVMLATISDEARRRSDLAGLNESQVWRLVDRLHCDVGGRLARSWNLPHALAEVVGKHHDVFDISPDAAFLVQLVKGADGMCRQMGIGYPDDPFQTNIHISALTGFHLDPDAVEDLKAGILHKLHLMEAV